jgi:hypothetical protein
LEESIMKTFDIATQTTPAAEFDFVYAAQRERGLRCDRVFRFRYINGPVECLPQYVLKAIEEAGYKAEVIGSSTYKYTLVGLTKVLRESDLHLSRTSWGTGWIVSATIAGELVRKEYYNFTRAEAIERFMKHYEEV